jgi:hypothetical protein
MTRVNIVIREFGSLKPDYSLDFDLPDVPKPGSYISIQRPDKPEPYGEDLIVEQVWWRLKHPETGGFATGSQKIGSVIDIFVECSPAVGPWSSDHWRDSVTAQARARGVEVPEFEVARLSIRQDEIKKP